jgi:sigma-B regulation protein RsbU (phosphoserine phosphatase)
VLHGLNQALCGKFASHFVTAAYLFVDTEQGMIDYAGAGHPPVIFYRRAEKAARAVQQNGLFLGMFPHAKYSGIRVPLAPGDRSAVYTEGVSEARGREKEEFGSNRLRELLEASPELPADAFADRVLAAVAEWTGRSADEGHDDDVTLLVIQARG